MSSQNGISLLKSSPEIIPGSIHWHSLGIHWHSLGIHWQVLQAALQLMYICDFIKIERVSEAKKDYNQTSDDGIV